MYPGGPDGKATSPGGSPRKSGSRDRRTPALPPVDLDAKQLTEGEDVAREEVLDAEPRSKPPLLPTARRVRAAFSYYGPS